MDLKQYFRKMRDIEASLTERYPVLVSLETADGGKPGILCEASRLNAARMIVEGRAVLASPAEAQAFRAEQVEARAEAAKAELAKRIQVAIVTESDFGPTSPGKRGGLTPGGK